MNASKILAVLGIAAAVAWPAIPGFAQQASTACPPEVAQARAEIWRVQAATELARTPAGEPASGVGRALAASPARTPAGEPASGVGRTPAGEPASGVGRTPAGEPASGVGRTPTGEPASGAGRALAVAPARTPAGEPASGVGRIAAGANAQFRVLAGDQDRKAFFDTLTDQERRLLYQTLSARDKKRLTAAVSEPERKDIGQTVSDQDAQAWAEKVVSSRVGLEKKIVKARALARAAEDLCKKGDAAGAAAKGREAMEALK